jgi:hypothetical protein
MRLTLSAFALLVIGLSFLPVVVLRATTPIQTKTNTVSGSVTSNAITFSSTPILGNRVVCGLMTNGDGAFVSIAGLGASWTQRIAYTTSPKLWIYDGLADGSLATVTFTVTSTASTPSLICAELDGAYTYDAVSTIATGSTTPAQTNTVTPTSAMSTFLFAVTAKSSGSTTGTPSGVFIAIPYDSGESNGRYAGAYANVTATTPEFTSWATNAASWSAAAAAYKAPAGGGGGSTPSSLSILGVGN